MTQSSVPHTYTTVHRKVWPKTERKEPLNKQTLQEMKKGLFSSGTRGGFRDVSELGLPG